MPSADQLDQPPCGRFADGAHRYPVRVYYQDTDAAGIVYHATYLNFLERARSEMMAHVGADRAAMLAAGEGGYVVAEATIRYRRSARLGEALLIVSRVIEVRSAACVVQQNVMREDEVIAEGRIALVFVGRDGRPKRQPQAWIEAFAAMTGAG